MAELKGAQRASISYSMSIRRILAKTSLHPNEMELITQAYEHARAALAARSADDWLANTAAEAITSLALQGIRNPAQLIYLALAQVSGVSSVSNQGTMK